MVNEHLYIVDWAIRKHIFINESVQGLGWNDLYQSGCVALCEAALEFDGSCQFETFAQIFVRNRLIDSCRKIKTYRKNLRPCYLEDAIPNTEELRYNDSLAYSIMDPDIDDTQEQIARQFDRLKKNIPASR